MIRAMEASMGKAKPPGVSPPWMAARRSEEHTSELQSPCNLVCRLLLEKKKKYTIQREHGLIYNHGISLVSACQHIRQHTQCLIVAFYRHDTTCASYAFTQMIKCIAIVS